MKNVVYALIVIMAIIHQDFWWWDNKTLVFGFMPLGLFYHALFSCMAAGVWALAIKWAWPSDIEEWAESADEQGDEQ